MYSRLMQAKGIEARVIIPKLCSKERPAWIAILKDSPGPAGMIRVFVDSKKWSSTGKTARITMREGLGSLPYGTLLEVSRYLRSRDRSYAGPVREIYRRDRYNWRMVARKLNNWRIYG